MKRSSVDESAHAHDPQGADRAVAMKRVLAWQLEKTMKKQRLTKAEMQGG